MHARLLLVVAVWAVGEGWSSAAAQAPITGRPRHIAWRPAVPLQGSLLVIGVPAAAIDGVQRVSGELAGEPLHFELIDGWFRAIGGIPISASARVTVRIVIERGGRRDTLTRRVPVATRRTGSERLRTDPRFLEPPDSLLPRIAAERESIRQARLRAHEGPRLWQGAFVRPRPGPVTSRFGMGRIFNGRLRSRHLGADFDGEIGDSVLAANRGVVALIGDLYYSGTTVIIAHGAGLLTGYLHLSRVLVAVGDTVAPGQLIGRVGASGRVTGPHLHWFASYGNTSVNPVDLLGLDLNAPLTPR